MRWHTLNTIVESQALGCKGDVIGKLGTTVVALLAQPCEPVRLASHHVNQLDKWVPTHRAVVRTLVTYFSLLDCRMFINGNGVSCWR